MKIYKIECIWDMPTTKGYFADEDKAQKAIDEEDWSVYDCTLDEVQDEGFVFIRKINVK